MTALSWVPQYRRDDGTFVILLSNGWSYHVIPDDPIFASVAEAFHGINDLPDEPPPPTPETIGPRTDTKNSIYARMTDDELVQLDGFLETLPLRQRMEWRDAVSIDVDRPDVRTMAAGLFGASRASEILGPPLEA